MDLKNRYSLPALLLLVGAVRHFAWGWFPPDVRGSVSKALGAAALLCLIWVAVALQRKDLRTRTLLAAALWWSFEELQTVLCSVAYAVKPWQVPTGQSICSAAVGADIGAVTLVAVAALALHLRAQSVRSYGSDRREGNNNE